MRLPPLKNCLCGGEIRSTNIRGETWPYRDEANPLIDEDLLMPVCVDCGEMMLDEEDSRRLGDALHRSWAISRLGR